MFTRFGHIFTKIMFKINRDILLGHTMGKYYVKTI